MSISSRTLNHGQERFLGVGTHCMEEHVVKPLGPRLTTRIVERSALMFKWNKL